MSAANSHTANGRRFVGDDEPSVYLSAIHPALHLSHAIGAELIALRPRSTRHHIREEDHRSPIGASLGTLPQLLLAFRLRHVAPLSANAFFKG